MRQTVFTSLVGIIIFVLEISTDARVNPEREEGLALVLPIN